VCCHPQHKAHVAAYKHSRRLFQGCFNFVCTPPLLLRLPLPPLLPPPPLQCFAAADTPILMFFPLSTMRMLASQAIIANARALVDSELQALKAHRCAIDVQTLRLCRQRIHCVPMRMSTVFSALFAVPGAELVNTVARLCVNKADT
jgi:hypothetical protein